MNGKNLSKFCEKNIWAHFRGVLKLTVSVDIGRKLVVGGLLIIVESILIGSRLLISWNYKLGQSNYPLSIYGSQWTAIYGLSITTLDEMEAIGRHMRLNVFNSNNLTNQACASSLLKASTQLKLIQLYTQPRPQTH